MLLTFIGCIIIAIIVGVTWRDERRWLMAFLGSFALIGFLWVFIGALISTLYYPNEQTNTYALQKLPSGVYIERRDDNYRYKIDGETFNTDDDYLYIELVDKDKRPTLEIVSNKAQFNWLAFELDGSTHTVRVPSDVVKEQ